MDEFYMNQAIELAKLGQGKTWTNPLVGAVIVKENRVIATGFHERYGQRHAEKMAIDQCATPEDLVDSTIYVTLEPCHHFGKQPPCTQAIKEAGISKVVIAQLDPNPLVSGKGSAYLESQGITVVSGIQQQQAEAMNRHYNYFYQHKRPYVVLKQAITLDGKVALVEGQRTSITGEAVYQQVHQERGAFQGILVGSGTILTDNPQLLAAEESDFPPVRIVLDRRGQTLAFSKFQLYATKEPIWLFTEQAVHEGVPDHVTVFFNSQWTIEKVLVTVAEQGIQSVYVEGGPKIHEAFLASDCFEEVITYLAPTLFGGRSIPAFSSERKSENGTQLAVKSVEKLGQDLRIVSEKVGTSCLQD